MRINKIKELKTEYKVLICTAITILSVLCIKPMFSMIDETEENFDYSNVYPINAVITKVGFDNDFDYYGNAIIRHNTSAYIKVELPNGETKKIELGGSTNGYTEGESIIIYTDGISYSTTKQGIAIEESGIIFIFIGISFIIFLVIVIWVWLLDWKGLLIGLTIIIHALMLMDMRTKI